uniref:Protein aurora borealis n=1 Tax=Anopheles coluzzii TaxID=1518534 RepID=A0A8W7P603_ANOCL
MESEAFLTPRKLFQSALARTSSRTSMASSPSLMAVRTPTSLSRNSTSSCNNTATSNRFNLLPVLQTPPSRIFKGRIVNPFEPHLVERLHLPMIGSPSLFHRPSTPQNSSITQFEWTIDEVSSLGPVNVEPHETQFIETPDPVAEARVQAAISTYFKEHSIVPSPIDCPLRNQKIVLSKDSSTSTNSSSGGAVSSKRKVRDGISQTVLSFPPHLPKEIEDVFAKVSYLQRELASEQDLKRSRYYGSQEMLNHIPESDADSSFGALSPISKSMASPSPTEAFELHHSDADAIYRSTPEPSGIFHSDNMSPELCGSRHYMSGSIKHTELTNELAEANLSADGERSLALSSQSSDSSQQTQHSTTPLRGFRRKEKRRTNRKNLSQSFLQISDKDRNEENHSTDSACEEQTMGHGHGHGPPYKVPDASIYKVADAPELVEVERALARRGLKDPWLRNEVWRYNVKQFSTHRSRLITFLFKGFPLGFAAFVATIGVEYALGVDYHAHGGHGHGDEKGHGSGHH